MEYYTELKQLLLTVLSQFMAIISAYLPNILIAVVLMLAGLFTAWLVKWFILRLGDGLDRMVHALPLVSDNDMRLKWPLVDILGNFLYWFILLVFMASAIDSLGLPGMQNWLEKLIGYLPAFLVACVFIFGGLLLGNIAREKVIQTAHAAGVHQATALGSTLRAIIVLVTAIAGLAQIGLDVRLFESILTIFVAALAGAIALAFGLGAGSSVSNIIAARYVRKNYQPGQHIAINTIRGRILELTAAGVVLDTADGRTFIPAKLFDQEASILLDNPPEETDA